MIDKSTPIDIEELKVVPLRHPGRWIATAVLVVILTYIFKAFIFNPAFQWPVAGKYLFHSSIINGLKTTMLLTVIIMILAVILGTVMAILILSPSRLLSWPARAYVWFFRGSPALIQLIIWFNLALVFRELSISIPFVGTIFSVKTNDFFTPFFSAVIALSLHEAGYMAEIVRGGISAVNKGQVEAANSLGMNNGVILSRIVIPQAMRFIIPPTGNETINLLKTTSLVSVIAVSDLLNSAQSIYTRTFETIPLLMVVTFWYLFVVSAMSVGQSYLERYYGKSDAQDGGGRSVLKIIKDILSFRNVRRYSS